MGSWIRKWEVRRRNLTSRRYIELSKVSNGVDPSILLRSSTPRSLRFEELEEVILREVEGLTLYLFLGYNWDRGNLLNLQ